MAGSITKASAATSAAAVERMPIVTSAANQTIPAKVAKELGEMVVWATASRPPPTPAMNAAVAPARTFIWTTLMPDVRAPAWLQRAALRARPVVERRRLTMKSDTITKITRHRYA